ncbi:putative transcriptional regulator YdeE [Paenibacillus sp. DS2015]|uniref:GyrI-like domain-containing protein n=1 Tax=Paenibacillus sp. DS2015 TaxID=3373917 RepID=UPI003D262FE0
MLKTSHEHKPQITLTGISVRTTNRQEAGPQGLIPELWERYFQSDIASQMDVRHPHFIYALYTDYESDATGEYTLLIGHECSDNSSPIAGLEQVIIPEAQYIVFETKRGPVQQVVIEAWQEIWRTFEDSTIKRTYSGDFELYQTSDSNPEESVVQIYIAVES